MISQKGPVEKGPVDRVVLVEPTYTSKGLALRVDEKSLQNGIVVRRIEAEAMNELKAAKQAAMKEHNIDTKALIDGDPEEYKKDREFIVPLEIRYNKIWLHAAMRHVVVNHNLHAPFVKFRDNGVYKTGTILEMGQVKLYWGRSLGSADM
jgi:hypothetical protein